MNSFFKFYIFFPRQNLELGFDLPHQKAVATMSLILLDFTMHVDRLGLICETQFVSNELGSLRVILLRSRLEAYLLDGL